MVFSLDSTKTWAAGAGPLATQREVIFRGPTYVGDAGGALTISDAATVAINAAPTAGANLVITRAMALWVQAGNSRFDGGVQVINDANLILGTTNAAGTAALIQYDTAETSDGLKIGLDETSRRLIIGDYGDISADSAIAADTNPMVYVRNAAATVQLGLGTQGTHGNISSSSGTLYITNILRTGSQAWAFRNDGGSNEGVSFDTGVSTKVWDFHLDYAPYMSLAPVANSTAYTASTEVNGLDWNTVTATWAQGAIGTERWWNINAPTIAFNTGSSTITNLVGFNWDTPPILGTNAVATNSAIMNLGADWTAGASAAGMTYTVFNVPAHTVTITGATQNTTNPAFAAVKLGQITVSDASAVTVDSAATLYIANAPLGGGAGPVAITRPYSLWIDDGAVRFDGAYLGGVISTSDATYNVGATEYFIESIRTDTGTQTINLPAAANNAGRILIIKDADGNSFNNAITIDGSGAETIDEGLTITIATNFGFRTLICDGTEWHVLGQ